MRSTAVAAAALVTLALAALPAHAGTRTREHVKIVGNTAVASWDYTQGNVLTFVNVIATENNLSGTGGKAEDAFVSLAISQSEIDTGNVLITGVAYVSGNDFSFTIDKDLNTATLHAHDAIFQDDNSFTFFNVDIDLTFTGSGEATVMKSHENFKEPGLKLESYFQGTFRDAVASGSIFGKNIQFAPNPSTSAQLQFNKFGSMAITTTTP
jgi:hypothetical protein